MRPALSFFNLGFTRGKIVSCLTSIVWYRSCGYSYILGDFVAVFSDRRNYSTQVLLDSTSERLFSEPEICDHPSTSVPSYCNTTEFAANNIDLPEICDHPSTSVLRYHNTAESAANNIRSPPRWSKYKDWQVERMDKLTASTFSQAVGFFSRRRVQLWLEKIGAVEPFPVRWQSSAAYCATMFSYENELEALGMYKYISGNKVSHPDSFTVYRKGTDGEWLGASPDGLVYRDGWPTQGVLEIKCPYFSGERMLSSPWKRVPCYYIPQAQGLMEILDAEWMDLFVWTVQGFSLFRIYRDREYWAILNAALHDFWWDHVQPAKYIFDEYVITDPCKQLEEWKPAPKHELCAHLVIKSREISDQSSLLVRGKWDDLFKRRSG